jgi:hypothetical protein
LRNLNIAHRQFLELLELDRLKAASWRVERLGERRQYT